MSFANYTAYRSNILTWLDIGDSTAITNAHLDDIIVAAENKINREVRSREQETIINSTITAGVMAVPSNYVALKSARIDGTPTKPLKRVSVDAMYTSYPTRASDGKPEAIAREGSNFIFGPYPDSAYTVKGIYYQRMEPLATTLHALFTNNEDLYLWAALSESEAVIGRDKRIALWEAKYQAAKNALNNEDFNEAASGGGLAIRLG